MTAGGEEGAAGAGAADSLATLFEVAASCDARMSELLREHKLSALEEGEEVPRESTEITKGEGAPLE